MKCDGIIVDYKLNGNWKHSEFILQGVINANQCAVQNDQIIPMIVETRASKEITTDNVAVFIRVHNWDDTLEALESFNNSFDRSMFYEKVRGKVMEMVVVNESLYEEWQKPGQVS